jgi:hypothetical protein
MTKEEWEAEGARRFGPNRRAWRFVCPSCTHVASVQEWLDAGATDGEIAFSCIGRRLGANGDKTFLKAGGPCNYAGGGLFALNPEEISWVDKETGEDVAPFHVFAFAEPA